MVRSPTEGEINPQKQYPAKIESIPYENVIIDLNLRLSEANIVPTVRKRQSIFQLIHVHLPQLYNWDNEQNF